VVIELRGVLEPCLLLTYRVAADAVRGLLPDGLALSTFRGWAFWNVVLCRVLAMRPRGVPRCLGVDYSHVAYRLHVRAEAAGGRELDGLYFVRSDADRAWLARAGNVMTDLRFEASRIDWAGDNQTMTVRVSNSPSGCGDADVTVRLGTNISLPGDSCFDSPRSAAAFLKYRPLGLATDSTGRRLRLTEVLRNDRDWHERPVAVERSRFAFFDRLKMPAMHLERAVTVAAIPYRWRLGRSVPLATGRADTLCRLWDQL
jgi:hypothetical protein